MSGERDAIIDGLSRAYDIVKPEPGMGGPHGGFIGGVSRERAAMAIDKALEYLAARRAPEPPCSCGHTDGQHYEACLECDRQGREHGFADSCRAGAAEVSAIERLREIVNALGDSALGNEGLGRGDPSGEGGDMTEWTAQSAVGALLAQDLDDEELGWEMLALLEAVDFEYERWCRVLNQDPDDPVVDEHYRMVHRNWAEAWTEDEKEFFAQIDSRSERWRAVLGQREKARVVA